jgi:ABC-2 type transport system ATP-binding protein
MNIVNAKNLSRFYYVNENKSFLDYFRNLIGKSTKRKICAVNDITFSIEKGEIVGLVGLNGAGKSTLIKMMTGILMPSSGELEVLGNIPQKSRKKNNYKLAAVFGQRCQLRWDISIMESYRLLKRIYKVSDTLFNERLDQLCKVLELNEFINQPVRTLSLGQKMRAELGAAFLHDPEIVFLDEPTIGLDIFSKDAILQFIQEIKNTTDTTIILTTHDLEDINKVCDRLIIIDKGNLIVDDKKENIIKNSNIGNNLEIEFENENIELSAEIKNEDYSLIGKTLILNNLNETTIANIMGQLYKNNLIRRVQVKSPEFTDVFKEIFSDKHKTRW